MTAPESGSTRFGVIGTMALLQICSTKIRMNAHCAFMATRVVSRCGRVVQSLGDEENLVFGRRSKRDRRCQPKFEHGHVDDVLRRVVQPMVIAARGADASGGIVIVIELEPSQRGEDPRFGCRVRRVGTPARAGKTRAAGGWPGLCGHPRPLGENGLSLPG
ncbi:hypothetical protein [Amycolatopsis sp. NPDC054798]